MLDARIWWTLSSTPRLWRVLPCLGSTNRRSNRGVVKLEKHLGIFMNFIWYSPENSHGNMEPENQPFEKEHHHPNPHFWVPYWFSGMYIICYISVHVQMTFWAGCCHLQGDEGPLWASDDKQNCKSCLIKLDRFWHRNLSFSIRFKQFSKHCLYWTIRQPLLVNHNSSSENHDLPTRRTSFICSHLCFPGIQSTNPFRILICITVSDRIKFKGFYIRAKIFRKKFTSGAWHCL